MFKAAFAATRFFDFATNRRTFKMRSGAYAHSRKLHGLSSGVTDWTGTTDVDRPPLDEARKILPTPYALAKDWLAVTLTGDWTSVKEGNAFVILVVTDTDAALVLKKFRGGGAPTKSRIADKSYSTSLRAETFAALAKDAGYAVTLDLPRRP
jgi:hypothetical protein